ncbi:uncharacterized protein LOC62_07G009427 [Vanrija pseudolonga]|uniref:F-box domain-containing protein n=1 Tax=Vanrija pseudolonga TaxID=143232 RepID=A0AAF0YIP8_9TREE|nr:hypothetical protein LOC62_07G009427 [Vanrija pseudolonga]
MADTEPAQPTSLPDLPADVLLHIADLLQIPDVCALRLSCTVISDALAPLRRRFFGEFGVLATPAGLGALLAIASDPLVAPYVKYITVNTASVFDTAPHKPTLYEQLALLELDGLDATINVMRVSTTGVRRHPSAPFLRPGALLPTLLGRAFAHLPKLGEVTTGYWNPRANDDNPPPDARMTLGLGHILRQQCGLGQGGENVETRVFWGLVFGLAGACAARKEAGFEQVKILPSTLYGVHLASFAAAMRHATYLAPAVRELEVLRLYVRRRDGAEEDLERELGGLAGFLGLAVSLDWLYLQGGDGLRVLQCLLRDGALALPKLKKLDLYYHETTTDVMFDILTNTHLTWVRLHGITLHWVEGKVPRREGSFWAALLLAVSAHHDAQGTRSAVTSFAMKCVQESREGRVEKVRFARSVPDDFRVFVQRNNPLPDLDMVQRVDSGEDIFRRAAEEIGNQ